MTNEDSSNMEFDKIKEIEKVVITMGCSGVVSDSNTIGELFELLYKIGGQRPQITRAKKSIATLKVRQNMPLGVKATLRKKVMKNFLEFLIKVALPRTRNFKGFSKTQVQQRTFAFGISDLSIFPQIAGTKNYGMNIVVVMSNNGGATKTKEIAQNIGFPFFN